MISILLVFTTSSFCQVNLTTFFNNLYDNFESQIKFNNHSAFNRFCINNDIDCFEDLNQYNYHFILFLHELLTSTSATDFAAGGILQIPYLWHWTNPNPDGRKYVGEYNDGNYHGLGIFTWSSGQKYVGEWKDNMRNGQGVLFKVNDEIQSGVWTNGKFTGERTIEAVDNFLKNKYPHFEGLDYEIPTTSVLLPKNDIPSSPLTKIDHGIGSETPPTDVSLLKNDIPSLPPPPFFPTFIAVVDFTGNNVLEDDCITLTDRLSIELSNTRYFKVYDREVMKNIFKGPKFIYSGCVTVACMVKIGEVIGVTQIVSGSISKIGNVYSVSARIINVETGEIENTGVYDHTGDIGGLLTEGMIRVAIELIK
jgi:TolB-like protein